MKILCVNINKYAEMIELLAEELNQQLFDFIIMNGSEDDFRHLNSILTLKSIYVGFSPLVKNELSGLCLMLSYVSGCASNYDLSIYEESVPLFTEQNPLAISLVNYFDSKDIESLVYYTNIIRENISKYYLTLPEIERSIKPYIDYNFMVFSLFKTSFGDCRFIDMEKGIFTSLRNKTMFIKLNYELSNSYKNYSDLYELSNCLDMYIRFVKSQNIDALVFYTALFLNVSIFNKKRNEHTIAYIYLLRAVETALIYHHMNNGVIEINDNDGLSFKGENSEISGVGTLITEYFRNKKTSELNKKIWKLNSIRNRVILTHGYYTPSGYDYDDLYNAAKDLVRGIFTSDESRLYYEKVLNCLRPMDKKIMLDKLSNILIN